MKKFLYIRKQAAAQEELYHPKQFLQNIAWGGSSRPAPLYPISPLSFLKCGLTDPKIAKIANFCYNFAKFGLRRESQVGTLEPNFSIVSLKIWTYSPTNR